MTDKQLPRVVKLGTVGPDVDAHARAMHRYLADGLLGTHAAKPKAVRETFGTGKRALAKRAAAKAGLPQYGVVGRGLYDAMRKAGAYDQHADQLLQAQAAKQAPTLVEPAQGWGSLHRSLWAAYSRGRRLGFADLGTYNPASRLPSGAPSDHAVLPAFAFDLGITPATGWANLKARGYVLWAARQPAVEYVILGDRIYFGPTSWHRYTAGGHSNHIHVSGNR